MRRRSHPSRFRTLRGLYRGRGGFVAGLSCLMLLYPIVAAAQSAPTLHIVDDTEARELVLELRGIDLPASADHHDIPQPPAQTVVLPRSGWLHGFEVEVVDGQGRRVPQQVLHHINIIKPGERELFSQIMLRIAAAGQETAPARLPRLLGLPVAEGDSILVTAMVHNPTAAAYQGVSIRVRFPYTPETAWIKPISIYPLYLDVMPPASIHAYDLPPGKSQKSWEGRPAISGRLLGVGGHLHDYGVLLRLEDVTAGKVIWEAEPILDESGSVVGMPMKKFFWRLGVPIRADHVYRLTAFYDNPTGRMIPEGAMGTLGGVFLPGRGATWPAANRRHPEYVLDVKLVTEGSHGYGRHEDHADTGAHGDHVGPGGHGGHGANGHHTGSGH